jgi:hypothetical protein
MAKNMNVINSIPQNKTTNSVGTRGESAIARNNSGNRYGNRGKSNRRPKNQH